MTRFLCTLLVLPVACAVLAAPAPKKDWKQYGWETPIDPDNDCKFDINDGAITIELQGGDHEFDPKRNRFNAPCVVRDVEGDFVVEVRISAAFRPSAKSSVEGEDTRVAAGLVLVPAEKNYVRLEYGAYRRNGKQGRGFANRMRGQQLGMRGEFAYWNPSEWKPNEEHIYVRIEREGNRVRNVISPDGKTWERYNGMKGLRLPDKFKVGLAAYSTSTDPFKVRFDQFKLTRGKKEDK